VGYNTAGLISELITEIPRRLPVDWHQVEDRHPSASAYESAQPLRLSIPSKHHLRVDAEGDLRVAVPDLAHDVRGIFAGSKQQRDEGAAE